MGSGCKRGQGQVIFLLLAVVVLVAFGFIAYIGNKVLDDVNTQIQANDFDNTSKDALQGITTAYPSINDAITGIILALMWIGGMVLAWFSDNNPIIVVILIIVIVALGVVAGVLSNTWDTFQAEYPSYEADYPITNFVLENYLVVVIVMGMTFLGAGFLKQRFG